MNEIKKKIRKQLKGLTIEEQNDILNYYEELVNDRLELGENIEDIKASLNYNEIKYTSFTNTIEKRKNDTINKSVKNSFTLLLFLFASPLLIPLGIVYLTIIFVIYVLIFSVGITAFSVPLTMVVNTIASLTKFQNIGDLLLNIGSVILISSFVILVTIYFIKLLYTLNNYLIKLILNFIKRKKVSKWKHLRKL